MTKNLDGLAVYLLACVKFTHSTQGHNDISSQMQNTAQLQLCKKVVKR